MDCYGEIRVYLGGRMELFEDEQAEGGFKCVWVTGRCVLKQRYQNRNERGKIINKALEQFKQMEIGIVPDMPVEEITDDNL